MADDFYKFKEICDKLIEHGWSTPNIARETGLSTPTIHGIIHGRTTNIRTSTMNNIKRFVKIHDEDQLHNGESKFSVQKKTMLEEVKEHKFYSNIAKLLRSVPEGLTVNVIIKKL